jgi:Tat protein secretion system quality control protein TatD with DNase activity
MKEKLQDLKKDAQKLLERIEFLKKTMHRKKRNSDYHYKNSLDAMQKLQHIMEPNLKELIEKNSISVNL